MRVCLTIVKQVLKNYFLAQLPRLGARNISDAGHPALAREKSVVRLIPLIYDASHKSMEPLGVSTTWLRFWFLI